MTYFLFFGRVPRFARVGVLRATLFASVLRTVLSHTLRIPHAVL